MPADSPSQGVLVIDAGTSALRAVVVGNDGETCPVASEPWRVFTPDDASSFARELDPRDVDAALDRLLAAAQGQRPRLAGVAVTGQRQGVVFVDDAGDAVFASPNIDGRAMIEGMAIDAAHHARVYAVTGHLPALLQAPAKLAWLRANRPAVAERVHGIVPLADWIASLLTGLPAMSCSLASEIGLLDISTGEVAVSLLETLEVVPTIVPLALPDGSLAGDAARAALRGLPVALCGADTQCALVAMAAIDGGAAGVAAGWSAPVQMVSAAPIMDAAERIWTGLHVVPGRWVLESNAGDCGRAWDWLCSMLSLDAEHAAALAAAAPPGAHDVLALLGPPAMHASAMSLSTGAFTMPMPLAMSSPDRGDLVRAALEATAYAIRANLEQLEDAAGVSAPRLALGGGMSRSRLFAQIVADVTGRPLDVARAPETSALGAAVISSPAFGLHATIEDAVGAMTGGMTAVEPRMRVSAEYDDCYERWRGLAEQLGSGLM